MPYTLGGVRTSNFSVPKKLNGQACRVRGYVGSYLSDNLTEKAIMASISENSSPVIENIVEPVAAAPEPVAVAAAPQPLLFPLRSICIGKKVETFFPSDFETFMADAAKMIGAKDTLRYIVFHTKFFYQWYPKSEYLTPQYYPEVTEITVVIQPEIRKDYTNHDQSFWGHIDSIENAVYGLSDWLWDNRCPNLKRINVEWAKDACVGYKYYDGERDFDRRFKEYFACTSYEWEYHPLNGNMIVERFMSDLSLDWTWITQHDIEFNLPASLLERSKVPSCCTKKRNPIDECLVEDEAAFNAILEAFNESRNCKKY